MKLAFSWSALQKHPSFSKDFLEKLSTDLQALEKAASLPGSSMVRLMLPHLGVALGAAALAGTYGYFDAKKRYEQHEESLDNSFNTLLSSHKPFSKDPDSFHQRFSELALISPTVASNPRLAQKIIESRMDKGFDLDDVHRLSAIEFHSGASRKIQEPAPAAQALAASAFGRVAQLAYPMIVTQRAMSPVGKEVHTVAKKVEKLQAARDKDAADFFKGKISPRARQAAEGVHMPKQGSEEAKLLVSEECLARMLADRYCMFKTAGIIPTGVKNFLRPGKDQLVNYVKLMALPLAIGGGIQLVNNLVKQREDARLSQQADSVFNHLKRTNDYAKENPELAAQAFDTLRSFAPALAAKPIIAKTFVEHVISSDGRIPPDTANMLAQTQQLVSRLNDVSGGGFIEGLKNPMSLFKHTIGKGKK
jgi:hypothetical protein